jgi:hypothetical protein
MEKNELNKGEKRLLKRTCDEVRARKKAARARKRKEREAHPECPSRPVAEIIRPNA